MPQPQGQSSDKFPGAFVLENQQNSEHTRMGTRDKENYPDMATPNMGLLASRPNHPVKILTIQARTPL